MKTNITIHTFVVFYATGISWKTMTVVTIGIEKGGEVGMTLQVEIKDLRRMLKEKCEEIIIDKKLAYELYCRICEIEEDDRFTIVDDSHEDGEQE